MLTRSERIKYRGLFLQCYEKGKSLSSKHLRIHFTETRPENSSKLPLVGFTVSKKFSKKAVARNKVKRRLREIYRLYRMDGAAAESLAKIGLLVITAKPQREFKEENYEYEKLKHEIVPLIEAAVQQI